MSYRLQEGVQGMKQLRLWRWWLIALGLVVLILPAIASRAEVSTAFTIIWSTIAGGGGSSADPSYILGGTGGQPVTGAMQGGQLGLQSGYWGVPGTPYAPPPPPNTPLPLTPAPIAPGLVPRVDGSLAVWEDHSRGPWNIFWEDLSTGQKLTITSTISPQQHPAVSRDLVVWQGQQAGNWDIYGAYVRGGALEASFPIYTGPGDQVNPAVSNKVVVWQSQAPSSNRWDIVGEDLTSSRVFTLTAGITTNINPALDMTILLNTPPNPNILTGTVVWQSIPPTTTQHLAPATDHWAIAGARGITATTPTVFTVTDSLMDHTNPAISANTVVWQEFISPTWRIAGAILITPTTSFTITTGDGDSQTNPTIYGGSVLYQDSHTSHGDDPAFHRHWTVIQQTLPWGPTQTVSNSPYDAMYPSLSNNVSVWQQALSGDDSDPQKQPNTAASDVYGRFCQISFSDVQASDYFYGPVTYLACHGVISGYGDGTFRPYANTTRAQMVKIVVLGFSKPILTPAPGAYTFADAPPSFPFFAVIETAAADNIVSGYGCGGPNEPCDGQRRPYFRPYANVTRGQLSKIDVGAAGWALRNPATATFNDVPHGSPFFSFVETAVCQGVISGYADHTFRPGANATRGQISKIVYLSVTATDGGCGASAETK
jgi:beta propeller repeat protein